jgi:Alr-MurF fusion protein
MVIAIVPVGYADGLNRRLGNGRGKLWIGGKPAPIVGNVCMDLTMIDVTGLLDTGADMGTHPRPLPREGGEHIALADTTVHYDQCHASRVTCHDEDGHASPVTCHDEIHEGDEVIIFGDLHPVAELAKEIGTIPYEVLTGISRRVKRIYYYE